MVFRLRLIADAETVGTGVCVPEVLVRERALRHDDGVLIPDAVATFSRRRAAGLASAIPDDLVMPGLAATALDLTVPLVDGPGAGAVLGGTVGVAVVPRLVPLHDEVVLRVGRIAPDRTIEHAVRAVGLAVEDAGNLVVPVLVESVCRLTAEGCDRRGRRVVASSDGQQNEEREEKLEAMHQELLEKGKERTEETLCLNLDSP